MIKPAALFTFFLLFFVVRGQEPSLPADLRQHSLNQYNANLFNAAFSLDRNNPQSIAFWTRWQWQVVDADPTTLFLNYSRTLNKNSAASIGFFQHNTGIYFNTGGALNYAYQIEFNRLIKLSVGANVFGFMQELADTRFPVNPIPGIPQSTPTDDFILQLAPGFNLQVENFSLSLASENLFDYNFTDKASNTATSDKIFMGMASYDFPVMASDSTAFVRPSIYLRTIPEQENQVGMNVLLSTQKYWIQSGYNNFYGISVGAGGTFFNKFSLGALVEFGTDASLNSKDPSFELLASYFLGKPKDRRPLVASGIIDESPQMVVTKKELTIEQMQEELEKAKQLANQEAEQDPEVEDADEPQISEDLDPTDTENKVEETKESKREARRLAAEQKAQAKQRRKDSIAEVKIEKEALAALQKQKQEQAKLAAEKVEQGEAQEAEAAAEAQRLEQQRKLDSISALRRASAVAAELKLKEEQRLDSIARAKEAEELAAQKAAEEAKAEAEQAEPEVVRPEAGEKYEEVANEDGLEPGYYLIANVFGTKKYFDAFMRDLTNKGLQPKAFYRSLNKYNYAYLERYTTIREARQARDSNFGGKYTGKTWIFRVVGK